MPGFGTRDPNFDPSSGYINPPFVTGGGDSGGGSNIGPPPNNPLAGGGGTGSPTGGGVSGPPTGIGGGGNPLATGGASATVSGTNTTSNPAALWNDPTALATYYAKGGQYSQGTGPQAYQTQQAALNPPAPNIGSAMYGATNPTQGQQDFAKYAPFGGYTLPNGSNGQLPGWQGAAQFNNVVPGAPPQGSNFNDYLANGKNFNPAIVGGGIIPPGQNQGQNLQGQLQGFPSDNINQYLQQLFGNTSGGFNSWGNPFGGNPYAFQTGQQNNGLNPLMSMLFGGGLQGNTLGYNQFQQNNPLANGGFNLGSLLQIINNMSQMQNQGGPGFGSYNGNFFSNFM